MKNESTVNEFDSASKAKPTTQSSNQKTGADASLPASKVFDLKVIPSERAHEPHAAHNFCATCTTT
jgi:hypothetical protein